MERFTQIAILLIAYSLANGTSHSYDTVTRPYEEAVVHRAKSILRPGNNAPQTRVKGTVEVFQVWRRSHFTTYFKIHISGLTPNSVHGFHVHQYGDIITKGCSSTGGHYNPTNQHHGAPTDRVRHVGDLGNVYADRYGTVQVIKRDFIVSLVGKYNVLGRAFVLHALKDDLGRGGDVGSRTTGNAGARIACGVIVRTPKHTRS